MNKPTIYIATQTFPPDLGGIQSYMHAVATTLSHRHYTVKVYADTLRGQSTQAFDQQQPYQIYRFGGLKPVRRRWKGLRLTKSVRQGSSGNVILCDTWKSLEYLPSSLKQSARILCLAHGMEFPDNSTPQKRKRIEKAFAKADRILANSRYTLDRLTSYLPDPERGDVLLPGITPPALPSAAATQQVHEVIKDRHPVLATISRIEPRKGHDKVLHALPALINDHTELTYVIIGSGPDKPRLANLVEELGLEKHVIFTGAVSDDEKNAWLGQADLFVMPSRAEGNSVEGFGLVYLEAAFFGVPSLAGEIGGAGDAVLHGKTGLLCDSTSDTAVKKAIHDLLADDSFRQALGQAAKTRVESDFLWPKAIDRLIHFFHC